MKLSNTSTHALRILSFMAREPLLLYLAKYLVEQLGISDKYLRRLMTQLTKSGFIKSVQGRVGGYSSAKAPSQIASVDIIESVAGTKNMADVCWDLMPVRMKILV
jgi:Rrf2 family protein